MFNSNNRATFILLLDFCYNNARFAEFTKFKRVHQFRMNEPSCVHKGCFRTATMILICRVFSKSWNKIKLHTIT